MRILVLGDSHGRLDLVHAACTVAQRRFGIGAAIQVGDLGLYPTIVRKFVQEGPGTFPVPLHVIDGNHEDHSWLYSTRQSAERAQWKDIGLIYHDRGSCERIGGKYIGFIGGALHADRRQEWAGRWLQDTDSSRKSGSGRPLIPDDPAWCNWVSVGDSLRAEAEFSATEPEVIISHSCPLGIGIGMRGMPELMESVERFIERAGFRAGSVSDCGEPGLRSLWDRLKTPPRHWLFGHFHRIHYARIETTEFRCVGSCDGTRDSGQVLPTILDTETGTVEVHARGLFED